MLQAPKCIDIIIYMYNCMSFTEADGRKENKHVFKDFVAFTLLFINLRSYFPVNLNGHLVAFLYYNSISFYLHFYAIFVKDYISIFIGPTKIV